MTLAIDELAALRLAAQVMGHRAHLAGRPQVGLYFDGLESAVMAEQAARAQVGKVKVSTSAAMVAVPAADDRRLIGEYLELLVENEGLSANVRRLCAGLARATRLEPSDYLFAMCRSIVRLRDHDDIATDEEIRAAALQFVRKISGYRTPRRATRKPSTRLSRRSPTARSTCSRPWSPDCPGIATPRSPDPGAARSTRALIQGPATRSIRDVRPADHKLRPIADCAPHRPRRRRARSLPCRRGRSAHKFA